MKRLNYAKRSRSLFTAALALLLAPLSAIAADGFATVNGNTTGGAGGSTVTVTTAAAFETALNSSSATVIQISGNITIGVIVISGKTNKTIQGANTSSGWNGNIQFKGCSNFIIQRLNISAPSNGDGITIQDGSHHFWVDHCTFGNCSDGQLDITHGSDYVTVSWCKFAYTSSQTTHRFCNLIGHDDANSAEDAGKLHVTMHHNWWSTLCDQRMPRVRYGQIHVYNNYYNCSGNLYCVASNIGAQVRVQNNYFENVNDPWGASQGGLINASGNTLVNTTGTATPTGDSVFTPPYSYTLDSASTAKTTVMASAGNTGGSSGGTTTTVTFTSIASEDGYVTESTETSNTGGSATAADASTAALRAGDTGSNQQYKTIVSFNTSSIPDGATIVSATLKLRRGKVSGTTPFSTHGSCNVDIKGGTGFGGATALAAGDFSAAADATNVATLSAAANNGDQSTGALNSTGRGLINKTGTTQFRVGFATDDNNNAVADYIGWYAGDDATSSNRPVLEVTYQ